MKFFTISLAFIVVLISSLASDAVPLSLPTDYTALSTRNECSSHFGTRGLVFDNDLEFELASRGRILSKIKGVFSKIKSKITPHPDMAATYHTGSPKPETPQGSRARPIANGKKDDYFGWVGFPSRVQRLILLAQSKWEPLIHGVNNPAAGTVRAKEGNRRVTSSYLLSLVSPPSAFQLIYNPCFTSSRPKKLEDRRRNITIQVNKQSLAPMNRAGIRLEFKSQKPSHWFSIIASVEGLS